MTDSERAEPLSNVSDSSFVILGQGSLSLIEKEKNASESSRTSLKDSECDISNITFNEKSVWNGQSQSKISDANSICEEGIQDKLNQVLRENNQLRETLSQNNLALKSQLDTFFMWQQEVLKTHETHKQKFLETKDLILKLRAENTTLKKQLEGERLVLNSNDNPQINEKLNEVNNLNDESKRLERTKEIINENENLKMKNQILNEELRLAKNEILNISKELEDALRENKFLKKEKEGLQNNCVESFTCGSLPNSEARAQISNLFKQLEEERAKVSRLKQQLEEAIKSNGGKSQSELCTASQLTQYINQLDDMNMSLDKQNQRFNSLQSWVSLAEENVNALGEKKVDCLLISEIKQLKSHLNQEENVCKQKQENLQEIRGQFQKLLEEYRALQQKLTLLGDMESSIQKYEDEISSLSVQLIAKDGDLISKQEECNKMKEEIKKLNLECEEVALLRVQLDLYQSDFKDERDARGKLAGEKEELAKEIRFLRRKLEESQRDSGNKEGRSSPLGSAANGKTSYICPRCSYSFEDLGTCEKHVDECLGNSLFD